MGGFHGGHSGGGGGGFHGGHSSYHGSSGGGHSIPRRAYHIHGHVYYKPYYGTTNGKPSTFLGTLLFGLIIALSGVALFIFTLKVKCDAQITDAWIVAGQTYEKYTFDYEFNGKTYSGYGDDDLVYKNGEYVLDIETGEVYPVYVNWVSPENYSFENDNLAYATISGFFVFFGAVIAIPATVTYIKHRKILKEIGDVNHDGKIDDLDLEAADEKEASSAQSESKIKYCPYCGAALSFDATECDKCGASHI